MGIPECKDCKWIDGGRDRRYTKCLRPGNQEYFTSTVRGASHMCGVSGKHFEPFIPPPPPPPKPPSFWKRLGDAIIERIKGTPVVTPKAEYNPKNHKAGAWIED